MNAVTDTLRERAAAAMRGDVTESEARRSPRGYPIVALGLLAATAGLPLYTLIVLAPEVARSLGVSPATIAGLLVLGWLAVALGSVPLAFAGRKGRRALVSVAAGAVCALSALAAALATGPWALAMAIAACGAAAASLQALHPALVVDSCAPAVRVRAVSAYRAVATLGALFGVGVVALLTGPAELTWRGTLLVVGALGLVTVLLALGLRDPGIGRFDGRRLRAVAGAPVDGAVDPMHVPRMGETLRGLVAIPTVRRLLIGHAATGLYLAPLSVYLIVFLEDRWGLGANGRSVVIAAAGAGAIAVLALFGRDGDRLLQGDVSRLLEAAWRLLLAAAVVLAAAVAVPLFAVVVALVTAAVGALALAHVAMTALLMTIVAPADRAAAGALGAVCLAGVGGLGGLLLTGGLSSDLGAGSAISALVLPGAAAAAGMRSARQTAQHDFEATVDRLLGQASTAAVQARGGRLPTLACRGVVVDFGYRRAMDGVDFAVERGELVAILGTNGAGKSTLLRVLSGLITPTAGAVRLDGADVTVLDCQHRARLGIAHVAGGASLFDPLTVRDSIALAVHAGGLRGRAARAAAAGALEGFRALAARVDARVATLSGGERQMLALAQALARRPHVLLIDELCHGPSPAAAAEVLAAVRGLHSVGTTIVFVEQAIEPGLSLAPRAIFLERGRVQFDGPSAQLRERHDLLRPMFLARAVAT